MHIAVVLDEFGGNSRDCHDGRYSRRTVGEIWDEHDEVIHD